MSRLCSSGSASLNLCWHCVFGIHTRNRQMRATILKNVDGNLCDKNLVAHIYCADDVD